MHEPNTGYDGNGTRPRVAVLISGRGSNMGALVDSARQDAFPAAVTAVISNRPGAAGLDYARRAGIETLTIDHKAFGSPSEFEAQLDAALKARDIELVCLAGFMKLLSAAFTERWEGRLLNIHPSLLPAFKGLNVHRRVIDAGVRLTGCTVHLVTADMDSGPILVQAAVPVLLDDTPDRLAQRVLAAEHSCYPHALSLYASGKLQLSAGKIIAVPGDPPEHGNANGTPPTCMIMAPTFAGTTAGDPTRDA
ncbi:phosphoribosylglycinamide formyltransferase [Fodinicurvata sp. EGI_FJ10296]|uniref:phosphoribosylglycinamide formyltransferase n=1 Tax=Fodinicurvata sp. EGI_FJ10296 TaxID=3231908 RepID=UPI00345720B6